MEKGKNRWYVEKKHYINADDYNVCMKPEDSRLPAVCIGSFRGVEELRKFGAQIRGYLVNEQYLSADTRDAYRQITRAIEAVEA